MYKNKYSTKKMKLNPLLLHIGFSFFLLYHIKPRYINTSSSEINSYKAFNFFFYFKN